MKDCQYLFFILLYTPERGIFMMLFDPEEGKTISNIIATLKKRIPNRDLLNQLFERIKMIRDSDNGTLSMNSSGLKFSDDKGTLIILINPDNITEAYKSKNGNLLEKTVIAFVDREICVKKESTIIQNANLSTPSSIQHQTKTREYKDNKMVHERTILTRCSTSIQSTASYTNEKEVYVNDDRIAYMREMTIDTNGSSTVSYHKCLSYNPKSFNDLENPQQETKPFIYETNENEFQTSIKRIKK